MFFIPAKEPDRFYVLGAVGQQGALPVEQLENMLEVIVAAGGYDPETADAEHALIIHADGSREEINLQAILEGEVGPEGWGQRLGKGDLLLVPAKDRPITVTVIGQAARTGPITMPKEQSNLSHLLSIIVPLPPTGDQRRVELLHADGSSELIDLTPLLEGEPLDREFFDRQLADGDIVRIPEITQTVALIGEIGRPGEIPLKPGDRVRDVIIRAGGVFDRRGKARWAYVARQVDYLAAQERGEEYQPLEVDLVAIMLRQDEEHNVELHDGDLIYIPGRPLTATEKILQTLQLPLTLLNMTRYIWW